MPKRLIPLVFMLTIVTLQTACTRLFLDKQEMAAHDYLEAAQSEKLSELEAGRMSYLARAILTREERRYHLDRLRKTKWADTMNREFVYGEMQMALMSPITEEVGQQLVSHLAGSGMVTAGDAMAAAAGALLVMDLLIPDGDLDFASQVTFPKQVTKQGELITLNTEEDAHAYLIHFMDERIQHAASQIGAELRCETYCGKTEWEERGARVYRLDEGDEFWFVRISYVLPKTVTHVTPEDLAANGFKPAYSTGFGDTFLFDIFPKPNNETINRNYDLGRKMKVFTQKELAFLQEFSDPTGFFVYANNFTFTQMMAYGGKLYTWDYPNRHKFVEHPVPAISHPAQL